MDLTTSCIKSIQKYCKGSKIVIVDNASPNHSGEKLKEIYQDDPLVHIILNNENSGFSKGNNIGFRYAKEHLKADYIIMANNDTEIIQDKFLDKINRVYEKTGAAVIGPKILLADGTYNPLYLDLPTQANIKFALRHYRRNLILNCLGIEDFLRKLFKKEQPAVDDKNIINQEHRNIILHGCFLIFTPPYIKKLDGLDERTFMYREEEFLALQLKKNNLHSIYAPSLVILHKEFGATKAQHKNIARKNRFFYQQQLKACRALLYELNQQKGKTK